MCLRMVAQIAIAGQIEFSRISCLADRQFTHSKPMDALPTLLPCRLCLAPTPALLGREGVARAARRSAPHLAPAAHPWRQGLSRRPPPWAVGDPQHAGCCEWRAATTAAWLAA